MTKKVYLILQITSAVLLILATIVLMAYCFCVELPEVKQELASNPDSNAFGLGLNGFTYFLHIVGYLFFGIIEILMGAFVLGVSVVLKKNAVHGSKAIALLITVQVLLLLIALINIAVAIEGGVVYLIFAIASVVSCVLWAVQLWGSVRNFKTVQV